MLQKINQFKKKILLGDRKENLALPQKTRPIHMHLMPCLIVLVFGIKKKQVSRKKNKKCLNTVDFIIKMFKYLCISVSI